MAAFYDYFNEKKYADAVKNVSVWMKQLVKYITISVKYPNLYPDIHSSIPQFLDLISTSGKWDQKSIETPIMLKEG